MRRIDYVPLLDKVGSKLSGWKGKLMIKAARAQLVNSVMTAVVTFYATILPLLKWLIKKIDKIRWNFFWKGDDGPGNKGGICLIKWSLVCKPKELGGSEFMTSTALVERFADGGSSTVGWMNRNHGRG
jgi:hypothetical protein